MARSFLGRFQVVRRLGAGGMGTVFEVLDEETGEHLALKRSKGVDAVRLQLFKNEFRSLSGVVHPNLVGLRQLFVDGDDWCFTQELVAGVPFIEYVRGRPRDGAEEDQTLTAGVEPSAHPSTDTNPAPARGQTAGREGSAGDGPLLDAAAEARLRPALGQLVAAIEALHRADLLHRDLKPSNVLVTRSGRLVVLDFGLVHHLRRPSSPRASQTPVAGSVPYMAPEQAWGGELTPASDWYSVGVMLYEALTGRLPYSGAADWVTLAKVSGPPASPHDEDPELPDDLVSLCMDLLQPEPDARPGSARLVEIAPSRTQSPTSLPSIPR